MRAPPLPRPPGVYSEPGNNESFTPKALSGHSWRPALLLLSSVISLPATAGASWCYLHLTDNETRLREMKRRARDWPASRRGPTRSHPDVWAPRRRLGKDCKVLCFIFFSPISSTCSAIGGCDGNGRLCPPFASPRPKGRPIFKLL